MRAGTVGPSSGRRPGTPRVVVRGDRHEVYLDGKRLFTETDGTLQAGVIGRARARGDRFWHGTPGVAPKCRSTALS